ncbi:hypothetical protein D3C77_816400 [compost metagenome]
MGAHALDAGASIAVLDVGDVADVLFEAVEIKAEYLEQRVVSVNALQLTLPLLDTD